MILLEKIGVDSLPIETMSILLGELNTEARCVALASTPPELTALRDINDNLRDNGAFLETPRRRFDVRGILETMPDSLATLLRDPAAGPQDATWATRDDGPTGEFAHALAGALLDFSAQHGIGLRTLIGEKRTATENYPHSVETRLTVLAKVALLGRDSEPFSGTEIVRAVQEIDERTPDRTVRSHVAKLIDHGYIKTSHRRPKAYELAQRGDGIDAPEVMTDFFSIVGKFAIGSEHAIEHGKGRAQQIVSTPSLLSKLVAKAYEATAHTGKTFTRRP